MRVLGLDPGKDGAGVILDGTEVVDSWLTKELLVGGKYAPDRMAGCLRSLLARHGRFGAALELAAGRGGEGRGSARVIGEGWGLWRGILAALEVPVITPAATTWTGVVLKDAPGDDPKARSIHVALSRLPTLDLTPGKHRKPHDGLAQAGCMAIYGQMRGLA